MKTKTFSQRILVLLLCVILCATMPLTAFAATNIPCKNQYTSGTGTFTFYIDTSSFSGYENTSIGHFTVETQGYSSSTYITVTVYYNNTAIASAWPSANEKINDIGFMQNFYGPAGQYKIVVSVAGQASSGWTGVWLYH